MSSNGRSNLNKEISVRTDLIKLRTELDYIKQAGEERDELLKQIISTQKMLAEKVILFENNQEHQKEQLSALQKDTKLQNKILWTILSGIIAGAIKMVFKL
jgi:hypothetical protein